MIKLKFNRKNLSAKSLSLYESFRLAQVLASKIDVDSLDPRQDPIDLVGNIVEKLSPEEYLQCVSLLTKENEETIKQKPSLVILTVFIEGIKKNQIITLVHFYKSLGL